MNESDQMNSPSNNETMLRPCLSFILGWGCVVVPCRCRDYDDSPPLKNEKILVVPKRSTNSSPPLRTPPLGSLDYCTTSAISLP